jgi:hypothetical protein
LSIRSKAVLARQIIREWLQLVATMSILTRRECVDIDETFLMLMQFGSASRITTIEWTLDSHKNRSKLVLH